MSDQFTVDSLRSALGERPFRFYEQVHSTQDLAREWAMADSDLPGGAVVIAEEQSAGRGRQGRVWVAPPGSAILCSIVVRPQVRPEQLQRLTMVGGVAVAETLAPILPGRVALKWPNDVLIGGKKVCGILSEATWIGDQLAAVIVGIGINVRTDFAGTPLAEIATSLETEAGREVDRRAILARLLGQFDRWAGRVLDPALMERWQGWLGTLGRRVCVYTDPRQQPSPFYVGVAERVDEDGALYVRLDSGEVRRVIAADVGLGEV
jgi:BirA family biotin operon repressor/biotin-[acetyl-CoA-carboxylase] ligase